jgi:hypothetical protein
VFSGRRVETSLLRWGGSGTHLEVVGRRDELLHLLAGEDVGGDEVALGVTVLAGLGGGDVNYLRRESRTLGGARSSKQDTAHFRTKNIYILMSRRRAEGEKNSQRPKETLRRGRQEGPASSQALTPENRSMYALSKQPDAAACAA